MVIKANRRGVGRADMTHHVLPTSLMGSMTFGHAKWSHVAFHKQGQELKTQIVGPFLGQFGDSIGTLLRQVGNSVGKVWGQLGDSFVSVSDGLT